MHAHKYSPNVIERKLDTYKSRWKNKHRAHIYTHISIARTCKCIFISEIPSSIVSSCHSGNESRELWLTARTHR